MNLSRTQHLLPLLGICAAGLLPAAFSAEHRGALPEKIPNLLCFWDFQDGPDGHLTSRGRYIYKLKEMNGPIVRVPEGVFGPSCLNIKKGQWLMIKRSDCPGLNIHGKREVTMVAWIQRKSNGTWQYVAGVWNEREPKRQYALITSGHMQSDYRTLNRTEARFQIHGYVSDVGGATPSRPFCFSYATGKTQLAPERWYMIAFTYDHHALRVYCNGEFDENGNYNPFFWNKPIFDGGEDGADFTVAQRAVTGWVGYPTQEASTYNGFGGLLAGLAVYDRCLTADEIRAMFKATMDESPRAANPLR